MEKIQFKHNEAPYLSAENLNQLQTNIETAISEVVESGSNENGSWTKWDDGTMICSNVITLTTFHSDYFGITGKWTYPNSFIEEPIVTATPKSWNVNAIFAKVRQNLTNSDIMVFSLYAPNMGFD